MSGATTGRHQSRRRTDMTYQEWMKEGEAELTAMPQPTREEDAALSLELARENASEDEWDLGEDAPECEWCGVAVPDGQSAYAPFCSLECEQEAIREARHSIHPRPEEVG
jgi:hypothetical protein